MNHDLPVTCAWTGCGVLRRQVNNWFVVLVDLYGVHLYEWEKCPKEVMKEGKHFCGLPHALLYVSNVLTQDLAKKGRESTLELKPPLARDEVEKQDFGTREREEEKP